MVGVHLHRIHLHLIQFWPLNLESIDNTAKQQQNICLYTFAQCWKTKLRKTKWLRYTCIGPACAKGSRNEKTKVHKYYSKTYEELITETLNSLFYSRGDAERSDYKTSRNIDRQTNIVTLFVSRTILKLLN